MNNRQLLDAYNVFCDIQNNQGRGRAGYRPKPRAEDDSPYRDLDYSGYHKKPNLIILFLYIERKRKKNGSHVFALSLTGSNTKLANLT